MLVHISLNILNEFSDPVLVKRLRDGISLTYLKYQSIRFKLQDTIFQISAYTTLIIIFWAVMQNLYI